MSISIVVDFQERGSRAHQRLTNYSDKKCPDQKLLCHKLDPTEKGEYFGSWKTAHLKSEKLPLGPASCLKSKKIYYPCIFSGCYVGCPCITCLGRSSVNKDDVKEFFDDHQLYHHTWHLSCNFCSEIFKVLPHYNNTSLINEELCSSGIMFHTSLLCFIIIMFL